jgi:hypothetical protein
VQQEDVGKVKSPRCPDPIPDQVGAGGVNSIGTRGTRSFVAASSSARLQSDQCLTAYYLRNWILFEFKASADRATNVPARC